MMEAVACAFKWH